MDMKRWFLVLMCMLASLASAQLSFDYQNITTNEVIYSLSKLTNTTIVAPNINQRISLRATDVNAQEALHILDVQLGLMKYKLCKENVLYVVRPAMPGTYSAQPGIDEIVTKVIQLRYGNAYNTASIIKDVVVTSINQRNWNRLLSTREPGIGEVILVPTETPPVITSDTFTNSIIVRGTQSQVNEVLAVIQMLDVKIADVYEVRVVHLRYIDAYTAQMILNQSMSTIVGVSNGICVGTYARSNAIIVRCTQTQWVHLNGLIVALDTQFPYTNSNTIIRTMHGSAVDLSTLLKSIFGSR